MRILPFEPSATNNFPFVYTMPHGLLYLAAANVPSVTPNVLPESVVTAPLEMMIFLITKPDVTYKLTPSVVIPEPDVAASVVTAAVAITIFLMRLFEESVTYKFVPSVVIPLGLLNDAAAPVASVDPVTPAVPAKVVTAPVAMTIFLMVLLNWSHTYKFVPSVVIPVGLLNDAAAPVASVDPVVPAVPAKVVTTLVAMLILLMVWLIK